MYLIAIAWKMLQPDCLSESENSLLLIRIADDDSAFALANRSNRRPAPRILSSKVPNPAVAQILAIILKRIDFSCNGILLLLPGTLRADAASGLKHKQLQ